MEQPQIKRRSFALPLTALLITIDGYTGEYAVYLLLIATSLIPRLRYALMPALPRVMGLLAIYAVLQCTVGLALGIVGLIKSIRRPRRVGGIVMSAFAVLFGVSSRLLLIAMQLFWNALPFLPHVQY
ncbi:MAG: hypothetical protein IJK88_04600 [Clostridia bacterium]|jgi:hypothetical protein|nr:hypothetical protein [Clostridia bacterium]MBR3130720.1 hypothetical protein [Clostridia bacterium]